MTEETKAEITKLLDHSPKRVYRTGELGKLLSENRANWKSVAHWSQPKFIRFLVEQTPLSQVTLESEHYSDEKRYIWREATEYELALSFRHGAYLTHATAIFLHGLNDEIPGTVYVNHEQSPKPRGGTLTQESIDRAFKSPQRLSKYVFRHGLKKILVINGKHTGRLGVIQRTGPAEEHLEVTNVERTLIDSAVRPAYAGGIFQVLEAFKRARQVVSVETIVATLKQLDYVYPYHQAIGFYMEKAGYDEASLLKLENLGIKFDFYASYGLKKTMHHKRWRLFYPQGL
ncbi:MAG: hypothetical protein ACFCU3_11630 [Verrucomicrobiales bacterium]